MQAFYFKYFSVSDHRNIKKHARFRGRRLFSEIVTLSLSIYFLLNEKSGAFFEINIVCVNHNKRADNRTDDHRPHRLCDLPFGCDQRSHGINNPRRRIDGIHNEQKTGRVLLVARKTKTNDNHERRIKDYEYAHKDVERSQQRKYFINQVSVTPSSVVYCEPVK